ncbi:MAG: ABC transporter permease [Gemmatimonadetes bacterium]|nr:ABC transporter permease [Gemmatimonadota bacterium]
MQARRTTAARVQVGGSWFTAILYTVEDFSAVTIGTLRPEVGAWPPDDASFIIERSSLDFSGAAVGDDVRVSWEAAPPVALPVRGVVRDVGLAPGWMEHVVYGFVTRRALERMGAPSTLDALQLVVRDRSLDQAGVRAVVRAVMRDLEGMGVRVRDIDVPVPGEHVHAAQMDSLLYTQGAFALMALALSAFLVVNLIAAMLTGQVREIGIMKAVGAQWQQVAALYLAVATTLGVAAVAVALPISLVAGRRYAGLKADLLNFPIDDVAIPWWVIVLQAIVGVVLPVLAASIPVWRGCRISVNDALRDVGIAGAGGGGSVVMRVGGSRVRCCFRCAMPFVGANGWRSPCSRWPRGGPSSSARTTCVRRSSVPLTSSLRPSATTSSCASPSPSRRRRRSAWSDAWPGYATLRGWTGDAAPSCAPTA